MSDDNNQDPNPWRQFGGIATVGIHLVITTVIGLFIGVNLDRWLDTHPVMTILWLVFGIAAGFLNLYREAKKM